MAQKRTEGEGDPGVLGNLPSTRPNRLGRRPEAGTTKPAAATKRRSKPAAPAKPKPRARAGPEAVRAGAPALDAPAPEQRRDSAASGTELVGAALRAACEVTRIGVDLGGQILRAAIDRLPR